MSVKDESVGQLVRSLRRQRGWTAQRLAEECARAGMPSLTRGTLAKIESGVRKSVTTEELVALGRGLVSHRRTFCHLGKVLAPRSALVGRAPLGQRSVTG